MNMKGLLGASVFCLLFGNCLLQNAVAPGSVGLGQLCQLDAQCLATNAYCNGDCGCLSNHVASADKTKCLPVATKSGDDCEEDEQCFYTPLAMTCKGGKCLECADNSAPCNDPAGCAQHSADGKCWKSKKLGEPCTSDMECWIVNGSRATRKCSTTCVCAQESDEDKCMPTLKPEKKKPVNGACSTAWSAFWAALVAAGVLLASPSGLRF